MNSDSQALSPTAGRERIQTIDILRGIAVLGILVVNMQWFNTPALYLTAVGIELWTGTADSIAAWFIRFFFEGKFISIFSLLFGLGMAMQMQRAQERGLSLLPFYTRRLAVLLVIGLIHSLVFWNGDVLTAYAVLGFFLLLFRNTKPRRLLGWALAILFFGFLFVLLTWGMVMLAARFPEVQTQLDAQMAFFEERAEVSLEVYRYGTIGDILRQNFQDFLFMWSAPFAWLPKPLALFLVGLYVGKRGILSDVSSHVPFLRKVARWGLVVGLVGNGVPATLQALGATHMEPTWSALLIGMLPVIGAPALAFFYISAVALLCQDDNWRRRLTPFAAVGRMALTNYLLHTLIATTLFYSYGLGLYGQVGPALGFLFTGAIYGLQLVISPWWLDRFRYGPMEWLWRTLTYGKLQPMGKAAVGS